MSSSPVRNTYLDQVVEQQVQLEQNLKARKAMAPAAVRGPRGEPPPGDGPSSGVDVRISGFWRWKTVVVPPNAYVVHTRKGRAEPVTLGLGVSFRYDPHTDAFLVVPGATQTIVITARCICKELQGLLVQAYVQWIIQDFRTAYRKLDFSDAEDPMRLVTLQLKEQAEAAVKDKVATMSIDDVLSDKQPIIEELTARLRGVAEGAGGTDTGLGLRIVTVQIKEAVVSSPRLWESLQKPFRAERDRVARLAELEAEEVISTRERETERRKEVARLEVSQELARRRAEVESDTFDRDQAEAARRAKVEEENARALAKEKTVSHLAAVALHTQRAQADAELELRRAELRTRLEKLVAEAGLALEVARAQAQVEVARAEAAGLEARLAVENALGPAALHARTIAALPGMLEKLPRPDELRAVTVGGQVDGLGAAVAQLTAILDALKPHPGG